MKIQKLQKLGIPKIYDKVYWSGFSADDMTYTEEIINNRNKFLEEFDVVKVDKTQTLSRIKSELQDPDILDDVNPEVLHVFDHVEFYRTKSGGVVMLNSPYGEGINECPGMEPYVKMYHPWANTFIKCFDTVADTKQWAKKLLAA